MTVLTAHFNALGSHWPEDPVQGTGHQIYGPAGDWKEKSVPLVQTGGRRRAHGDLDGQEIPGKITSHCYSTFCRQPLYRRANYRAVRSNAATGEDGDFDVAEIP